MRTLLLDVSNWDLVVDVDNNIAVASNPYALAQNAASAIRLFKGELWFNTAPGIPYFEQILGKFPPVALMKALFVKAALTVPGVVTAACFITSINDRVVTGQIQITDSSGTTTAASF